jgi:GH25 family lysozyme M1 (1,4-beta-N-acetylmuramidase)
MNKKKLIIIIITLILITIISVIAYNLYEKIRVEHAIKIVVLKTKKVEVYSDIDLESIIKKINGKLIKNEKIDTTKLGKQDITFSYITNDNIKVPYTITINVVDTTAPIISLQTTYNTYVGTEIELEKELFCGDNYDDNPKCTIEGSYDLNTIGSYPLTFKGEDSSGNVTSHNFTLNVKEKKNTNSSSNNSNNNYTDFNKIIEKYKTSKTKIGIDVSHWQGDIDFEKVKESGVEFAYIRVGRGNGIGEDLVLDSKFIDNILGFNNVGIPVGVYFYSDANSEKSAIKEAKWIISNIKKYNVDLEIVFDWENWSSYQEYGLSFYNLTKVANTFTDYVESHGYKGMVYSSKNYLENIWNKLNSNIWLAHYTDETNYSGNYNVWQICNDGKVEGISSLVDIDIMYN